MKLETDIFGLKPEISKKNSEKYEKKRKIIKNQKRGGLIFEPINLGSLSCLTGDDLSDIVGLEHSEAESLGRAFGTSMFFGF